MIYQVKEYYYSDGWHYSQTYLETEDFEKALKRFYEVIQYSSPLKAYIWIEFSLLGIDELGQITTFIETRKRSNI